MKKRILNFSNGNMAGYEWRWEFYLESKCAGAYTLSCRQIVIVKEDEPLEIDPVSGLRDGVDVYDALYTMVSDAGYDLSEDELPGIAQKLTLIDPGLADEFREGPDLLAQRRENETREAEGTKASCLLRHHRQLRSAI